MQMRSRVTKPCLVTILVLVLTATSIMTAVSTAEATSLDTADSAVLTGVPINSNVTVGVKSGDWMDYTATYVGADEPPEEYPEGFKFQIIDVQGTLITANMTYKALNGTVSENSGTYDLKIGVLQLLVIPAGLTYADVFYHEEYGNITIAGTETGTYAGQTRTVVYATFDDKKVYWDKYTGIFLQSQQVLNGTDVAQDVKLFATNLWLDPNAPDNSGTDELVFYVKIAVLVVIAAIILVLLMRIRKRGK
jgi:hypothetical protein